MARPSLYTPELIDKARTYLTTYKSEHNHPIPSHVGLARVLSISKTTLYRWAEENPTEFRDILEQCNSAQEMDLLHGGLTGDFNAAITKLALGMQGYKEQSQSEVDTKVSVVITKFTEA